MSAGSFIDWFSGGTEHPYMRLFYCMKQDTLWVSLTIALDLAVAAGYILIAKHWWVNQRSIPDSPARRALGSMRNIFVFCGICGYTFIPIKMFWPAWRLYDMFMVFLVYFTWKYAWGARDLKVVYNALGRNESLAKELKQSKEDAQRKGFFLNAISHDLRTPLNGLMLHAEVAEIAAHDRDPATLDAALAQIKSCATATAELLNSFLEIGRLDGAADSVRWEQVPLNDLLSALVRMHGPLAEAAGLALCVTGTEQNLMIRTDRLKLERVLNNLLANAVKFTRKGSIELNVSTSGREVRISVIDTGIGISPTDQARLFEEFYQVHNHERDRRKGFGLGLAISRRLLDILGGDICVTSELGVGSRFTVSLPRALDERHVGPEPSTVERSGAAGLAVGV